MKKYFVQVSESTQPNMRLSDGLSLVGGVISTVQDFEASTPEEAVQKLADFLDVPVLIVTKNDECGAV